MTLITSSQLAQLLANARAQHDAQQRNESLDFNPVVKLFTADANCTWLLTELDGDGDLAFGLADLGLGCPELGYVSLTELRLIRGQLGLPVEQDEHFAADKTLSAYADEARRHGRIVTLASAPPPASCRRRCQSCLLTNRMSYRRSWPTRAAVWST